jgi:hypothetical protein
VEDSCLARGAAGARRSAVSFGASGTTLRTRSLKKAAEIGRQKGRGPPSCRRRAGQRTENVPLLLLHLLSTADLGMGHARWARTGLLVHQFRATLLADVTITNGSRHAVLQFRHPVDDKGSGRSTQPVRPFSRFT